MQRIQNNGFSIPTTVILSFLMLVNLGFFLIARSTGLGTIAATIMTIVYLALFALMLRTGNIARYRRIFFALAAFLFFPDFIALLVQDRGSMTFAADTVLRNENPICHRAFTMLAVPYFVKDIVIFPGRLANYLASIYSMLVIWFFATIIFGRGWCGWICFYGGWDDSISRMAKKPLLRIDNKNDRVRYFGFVMLAFVALASLPTLTAVYCEWLCPFRMITEFHAVTGFITVVMFIVLILVFIVFVIILPFITKKRMQCMTFCPFGAMQSILGKISFYKVRIDTDKCSQCMECVHVCPTMSMSEESIRSKKGKPLITCTMCGECITMCPQKAIDYSFCGFRKPKGGLIARLREKYSARDTIGRKIVFGLVRTFEEIVSPRALFIFAAFTFGMIIASAFGTGTIQRILNLFINGSFLLR